LMMDSFTDSESSSVALGRAAKSFREHPHL
jgi:hypothetical protein